MKSLAVVDLGRGNLIATHLAAMFDELGVGVRVAPDGVFRIIAADARRLPAVDANGALGYVVVDGNIDDARIPAEAPGLIARIRAYPGLEFLARAAGKPMFLLSPADGATGGNALAVVECYDVYKRLAEEVLKRLEH
ncbi:MAG: hypothetical protein FJW38_07965 [Acidobacteria bacterium]|nr:hypothetical protein [Acidobacteriota bacterium]